MPMPMPMPMRLRVGGAAAGTVLALGFPMLALAQVRTPAPKTAPAMQTTPPSGFTRPPVLRSLLDTVVWEAARRGPLLIVAPETTPPFGEWERSMGLRPSPGGPETLPPPAADGSYRLADLGPYFGRRAQVVGKSLTVFAPTTMTTLPARLPPPDPYTGLRPNEKLRLFQSTLTPAQWQRLGAPEGIGIGDLDRKQRGLFLSLLPDPFVVQPVRHTASGQRLESTAVVYDGRAGGIVPKTDVTLTPDQRQNVRLSLHRTLDWYFTDAAGKGQHRFGVGGLPDDGARFEISGVGLGTNAARGESNLFGVSLLGESPNRLKPTQLSVDWAALDTGVSLDGAATVGDLIRRTASQTHVALFCDPRYRDLAVYVRSDGRTVRAGDLLQALCWAVTGAFRKVGKGADAAFVLTDDVEGLGTRHARLQAWASANAASAARRRQDVENALAKTPPGDLVGWSASDPLRPGDALRQQIEDSRKKPGKPLMVRVSDLPASAQEMVRRQMELYEQSQQSRKNDPFFIEHPELNSPLQKDRVVMDVQLQASFVSPDIGVVSAQGDYGPDASQRLTPTPPRVRPEAVVVLPSHLTIPSAYKRRVLLAAPQNGEEAVRLVAAAKAHGLTEVWIDTPASASPGTLDAALAAGKKENIGVAAVVRLLRVPGEAALPPDRNLAGETTTEYAVRRADAPFFPAPSRRPVLTPRDEAERLRHWGDWLVPDDPSVAVSALKRAAAIAQTPGLAGIVLRDVAAPGYDGAASPLSSNPADGAEQMGYTEPMRLAFLRETGLDPIDLSPLPLGSLSLPMDSGGAYSPFLKLQLPFFPDYGPDPGSYEYNGRMASEMGAKDGANRWSQFRIAQAEPVIQSVVRAIHARQSALPVWIQRGGDSFDSNSRAGARFFDNGKPIGEPSAASNPVVSPRYADAPHSPGALLLVRCLPLSDSKAVADPAADDFARRLAGLMARPPANWAGFVIDLTDIQTPDRALPLLDILPSGTR